VTTHTDVTEKRKAADVIAKSFENLKVTTEQLKDSNIQLERSNFDLHQFASIASHDLKEPLRKIQAFGNILKDKISEKLSEEERNYFNKMISSSERMQILIEDVLSLSKLSNSALLKNDVDLEYLIQGILDDLEISIKEKNAVVELGDLPKVKAVSGQMRQLFQNLISNGLKFRDKLKPNPKIEIRQKAISANDAKELGINRNDFVCISVKDNGIGFEDEYKEKIFGIFQRLHGRNYEGTGIGLAIARKIIENHSGYIFAKGKVNEGAEFLIFLPVNNA
jgi:two-component system CheB/CheR fusion protein